MEKIVALLNHDLADEYILLTKTKKYHWNVVDPRFNDLHKFLDEQYELLSVAVDDVAERARALKAEKQRQLSKSLLNHRKFEKIQESIRTVTRC